MSILNLTGHNATPEQFGAGVVDPIPYHSSMVQFYHHGETYSEITSDIESLVAICIEWRTPDRSSRHPSPQVMVDGPLYVVVPLVAALYKAGFSPVSTLPNGEIIPIH